MSSFKRKQPSSGPGQSLLQRRVRPRIEPEPESDIEKSGSEAPSEEDIGSEGLGSEDEEGSGSDAEEDSEAESEAGAGGRGHKSAAAPDFSQLSFGALAKAQASLGMATKRRRRVSSSDSSGSEDDSDSDAVAAEEANPKSSREIREGYDKTKKVIVPKRSNKHAPVEMSAKKPVSRKRDFIEVPKKQARDPRFAPLPGSTLPPDEGKLRRNYAFLDQYQDDEMRQLREAIKKTKDASEKEKLQRALLSMESKKKARVRKDKERELLEEHRRQEKELVRQGKQPFYLKKSEQKKRLLVEQFAGMKKSQVDKAIERKRKKVAGKEKKSLPFARRTAEDRI